MYSRFQNRPEEGIRIPEHYSGCAFSQSPSPSEKPREEALRPRPIEPTRPSPPSKTPPLPRLPPPAPPKEPPTPPSSSNVLGGLGKSFPFSHGIGFDELLLLGLILLLAQSKKDHETLLWLALLLFCG